MVDVEDHLQVGFQGRTDQAFDLVEKGGLDRVGSVFRRIVGPADRQPDGIEASSLDAREILGGDRLAPAGPFRRLEGIAEVHSPAETTLLLEDVGRREREDCDRESEEEPEHRSSVGTRVWSIEYGV